MWSPSPLGGSGKIKIRKGEKNEKRGGQNEKVFKRGVALRRYSEKMFQSSKLKALAAVLLFAEAVASAGAAALDR